MKKLQYSFPKIDRIPISNNDSDNEDDGDLNNLSAIELHSRAEYIIDFLGL